MATTVMEMARNAQHPGNIVDSEEEAGVSRHLSPSMTVLSGSAQSENVTQQLRPVTRRRQIHVLLSSFLTICITIGFNQCYGVFQSSYVSDESTMLSRAEAKDGALIALVGTLGAGLTWGGSIVINPSMARTRDRRYITVSGVILMSLGFALASLATRIWHLLLTQGLLYGIGSSMMYFPILSVAPEYFDQHRGSAMGFVLSGAGVGGLVLSPIIRLLIAKISIRWTLRFLCFLNLVLSLPIALTIAPSRFTSRRPTHIDISTARRPTFLLSTVAAFLQASGNLVPLTFLPEYSTVLGYSAGFGAVLLAINNGINSASRIVAGAAGDRLGRQNTLIFTVVCSAITVCSFWLTSVANESKPLWLAFVVFYGIFAGGYNALFPTTIAEVFGMQAYASVNGFIYFIRGMGSLFGSPVGGAILGNSVLANYRNVVWFDSALLFGASLCVIGS
ncbi:hypothetical protein B0A49_03541 [Cryomyces minteri]|uniref:Major facilitator superfamily (MFS) profile domain-containing protein n=1 Tax=Cryomyces minteri TaxID=331657 RepID=A0A4V5NI69_9PEZI|nr:hypothetical protein B0A49_03541 [Cryomyces minteri]